MQSRRSLGVRKGSGGRKTLETRLYIVKAKHRTHFKIQHSPTKTRLHFSLTLSFFNLMAVILPTQVTFRLVIDHRNILASVQGAWEYIELHARGSKVKKPSCFFCQFFDYLERIRESLSVRNDSSGFGSGVVFS